MKKIFRFCLIASLAIPCALFARREGLEAHARSIESRFEED